jgi:hypothetical protein
VPPTRTGAASQVDGSGGNGSTGVTVPADCTLVVAFFSSWDGNSGATVSALSLNGTPLVIAAQLADGHVTDANMVGVASLASPPTGTPTFAWTYSAGGARSEGGEIILVYVKDDDGLRDGGVDSDEGGNAVAVTLDTETDDLLLVFAESIDGGGPPVITGATTTFIDDAALNSHEYDVGEVAPGAVSTTVNMTGESYSAMACASVKAESAAALAIIKPIGGFGASW